MLERAVIDVDLCSVVQALRATYSHALCTHSQSMVRGTETSGVDVAKVLQPTFDSAIAGCRPLL
jgi:hypothetical protein